jgi:regulator of protease activity HflC (stomatin/prohibitin superfamily)
MVEQLETPWHKAGRKWTGASEFILRKLLSPEYAASVEQKQIAEQLAQQAVFVVQQRKQEAEQARQVAQGVADASVIRAQGDAEARLIQADAESKALLLLAAALEENPDLLTYQYILKLSPGIEVMLVPNDTPYLLPLPSLQTGSTATIPELAPTPESSPPATTP